MTDRLAQRIIFWLQVGSTMLNLLDASVETIKEIFKAEGLSDEEMHAALDARHALYQQRIAREQARMQADDTP